MVLPIKPNNNLAKLLIKYSDIEIANYFNNKANLNYQISVQYKNNI